VVVKVSRRVRLLNRAQELTGASFEDLDLEGIRAARESRVPPIPVVGGLLARVADRVLFGQPVPGVAIDEMTVPGPAGLLSVRRYRPAGVGTDVPLLVFFHGGGWVIGSPKQYDWLCTVLARDAGVVVASVDYRKAPEHPAPAAVDDALAATAWLAEHADEVGATGPVFVAGDSAGGNLSALVSIAARDGRIPPVAGQLLIYPGTDLTMSFPSIDRLADAPILPRASMAAFVGYYLSGGIAPDDPRVSPFHVDDLTGVAPALVQTAEHDPLVDEGHAYADRLAAAGVPVRRTCYVGMPHGFVSLPGLCPPAHQAVAEMVDFIRTAAVGR
jgi:acetyl esterase/lipase